MRVQAVRKTENDGVTIRIKGEISGNNENLIKAMQEQVKIYVRCKTWQLIIRDFDGSVGKEDVMEALIQNTRCKPTEINLGNLRKTNYGEISTVGTLSEEHGTAVLKKNGIEIGWTNCRVQERVESPFCGRCQNYSPAVLIGNRVN